MQYLTAFHWQQGDPFSLVLQQMHRKKGNLPILFACLSGDGAFAEGVTEWFGGQALPWCSRGSAEKIAQRAQAGFRNFMEEWKKGRDWPGFAALFCAGGECFYAWRGDVEIRVMNMRFGKAKASRLTRWTGEYGCESAVLEEDVGLFLGSGALCEKLPPEVFQSCLTAVDLNSQSQADRHLADACEEAASRGAESTAAIVAVTKAGGRAREAEASRTGGRAREAEASEVGGRAQRGGVRK